MGEPDDLLVRRRVQVLLLHPLHGRAATLVAELVVGGARRTEEPVEDLSVGLGDP